MLLVVLAEMDRKECLTETTPYMGVSACVCFRCLFSRFWALGFPSLFPKRFKAFFPKEKQKTRESSLALSAHFDRQH